MLRIQDVVELADQHRDTWRERGDLKWYLGLLEEVLELGLCLLGLHEGPVDWELLQIAAIALNWLDKGDEDGRNVSD